MLTSIRPSERAIITYILLQPYPLLSPFGMARASQCHSFDFSLGGFIVCVACEAVVTSYISIDQRLYFCCPPEHGTRANWKKLWHQTPLHSPASPVIEIIKATLNSDQERQRGGFNWSKSKALTIDQVYMDFRVGSGSLRSV